MKKRILTLAASIFLAGQAASAASSESTSATTTYHRATIDGVGIFYREAGPTGAPTIVLLHGFPSSSREFDTLIPLLATRYHLIAPDFPGFGQSDAPPPAAYAYTFDHLAETTDHLLTQLKIDRHVFFLHDYGGPVGFRIMLMHPERIAALIVQNANSYKEGLGAKWAGIAKYWSDRRAHPEVFDAFVSFAARSICSTPAISRSTRRTMTSRLSFWPFWRGSTSERQHAAGSARFSSEADTASHQENASTRKSSVPRRASGKAYLTVSHAR